MMRVVNKHSKAQNLIVSVCAQGEIDKRAPKDSNLSPRSVCMTRVASKHLKTRNSVAIACMQGEVDERAPKVSNPSPRNVCNARVAIEHQKAQSRHIDIRAMQRWRDNSLRLDPATLDASRIGEKAKEWGR